MATSPFRTMLRPSKPTTFDVWQRWAKALQRQYTLVAKAYAKHGQQEKAGKLNAFLGRLNLFIDPVAHAHELAKLNYIVKGSVDQLRLLSLTALHGLFREALQDMPGISDDMRELLDSSCYGECNGREATDIFKGPYNSTGEGIGSGISDEHGTLAWSLLQLLDQAEIGGDAYLAQGLTQPGSIVEMPDDPQGPSRSATMGRRRLQSDGGIE